MEIKINALLPNNNNQHWVQVFGYTSKSQPGLEINGINGKGRSIKEKITFLSKKRRLRYPLKRFVLCVEGEGLERAELDYLELPLLICFFSMAGFLPIKRLDNCFAMGKISLEGEIQHFIPENDQFQRIDSFLKQKQRLAVYLGPNYSQAYEQIRQISAVDLLQDSIGGFCYMDNALARSIN